jgi:bifunctional non-homologous end joining protein LigD
VAVPRAAQRDAQWIDPELVAEIAYADITPGGMLRHASFVGLRDDKPAAEVCRDVVVAPPAAEDPIGLTHGERVIFPGDAITKRDLAVYYRDVGALFVPGLAGRPLSLVRCPQGRAKQCFFQKHDSGSFGDAVHRFAIADKAGKTEDYLHVDSDAGVLACVQMGTIEFHIWGSRVDAIEKPDRMVFDLDPDAGVDFAAVKSGAVLLRDALGSMGLASFALLSGGKGIHVVVPLTPAAEWPAVADFASRFARAMASAHPDRFVATMSKAKRKNRICIDWLRNQRGATAVAP